MSWLHGLLILSCALSVVSPAGAKPLEAEEDLLLDELHDLGQQKKMRFQRYFFTKESTRTWQAEGSSSAFSFPSLESVASGQTGCWA
jgi:hypothetical protein